MFQGSADGNTALQDAALGKHGELCDVGRLKCVCRPEKLRLRSSQGELVGLRNKAVNRCKYCARLAAIENAEMLHLDALEGDAPEVWMVLGTRTATVDMARFYRALTQVKRGLKRRWPAVQYACCLEFTTGYGPKSGGRRRPHWNLLLKGVPADQAAEALAVAAPIWCRGVDAEPHAQHATSIYAAGGLTKYLALHFCKESQTPPESFKGQRFNCSRGYFTGCTRATARARAKDSLAWKRELWKAQRADELGISTAAELDDQVQEQMRIRAATTWTLTNERGARLAKETPPLRSLAQRLSLKRAANPPRRPLAASEGLAALSP